MLQSVLKPLLVIVTLGALLVALVQVAGRITATFLDDLEPVVNQALAARGLQVAGLSGDWRMLNPVIRADRVDLPAGHLRKVTLEVDMVESVLRGALLARRLQVTDGEVTLEKPAGEAWRLRGATHEADFDPTLMLEESNQLEVAGRLVLDREGAPSAAVELSYLALNRGGEHRHALELRNDTGDCPDSCSLRLNLHRQDALWPLRPERTRLTAHSDGFLLPRPVLGISLLEIAALDLRWQRSGDDSGGAVRLRTEHFDMPGDVTLAMELEGALRGREDVHAGSITGWRVEQGEESWTLPQVAVNADADAVSVWMPRLDLARASAFLRHALAGMGPAERWLGALNLRGSAHNVRASYGLDGSGLHYAFSLDQVALDGYKGVPTVRNAGGELFGYERGLQLNLNAQNMGLAFPDVFTDRWTLPYAQGVLQAWFGPDYFGVRGLNLRAEAAGTRAAGGFAMTRPPDREGQRLLMLVSTDRMEVAEAQRFIPYKLPQQLRDWLQTAPRGGVLEEAQLAYQGQFREQPGELGRRMELAGRVRDGHVRYHPDWPEVTDLDGVLAVAGPTVEVNVDRARSAGAKLTGTQVRVVDNASAANVSLDAETGAGAVLEFLRTTPLASWLTFLEPDWEAGGGMRLSGELHVPLNAAREGASPAVRLRGDLEGVDVNLPGYRMALGALEGTFRYRYPHQLDAAGVTGRMFGAPVTVGAETIGERVHLSFAGRAGAGDVWRLIDVDDPGIASGTFNFEADLGLGVAQGAITELAVSSVLEGLRITLPAGYGKPAKTAVPARVRLAFLPDHRVARFDYRDAVGWMHFDQAPLRGAIGFGEPPLAEEDVTDSLVLGGRLDRFELADVVGAGEGSALPLPVHLDGLHVGEIGLGDLAVTRATLYGRITDDAAAVGVDSAEVTGEFERRADAPLGVSLDRVVLPGGGDGEDSGDPLSPDVIPLLPAADVDIRQLTLGDQDYGSWGFELRPADGNLEVRGLEARVRGVEIQAPDGLLWRADTGETRFVGTLQAGDLSEVLPQWGYAPNVETDSATLTGAFSWSGSPLMVDLLALRGEGRAIAEDGRFLEVESGAGARKILSLLNFTAIAKRISLNFSDVFGRGVSFDELNAEFSLNEGLLEFLEPMEVTGTGSEFRISGTVDMAERRLDNDMIVTLPVSKGLPWYAAYVALANPLAGLGVLVGERVLRKPIEQFSSARYHISGTLDDPDVKLVSVFDDTPVENEVAASGTEAAPPHEPSDSQDAGADSASGEPEGAPPTDE